MRAGEISPTALSRCFREEEKDGTKKVRMARGITRVLNYEKEEANEAIRRP